jgi:hypothetical protein
MLSIIGIKITIKQHTADMNITDSVDYNISIIYLNLVCYITHIGPIPLYTIKDPNTRNMRHYFFV